MCKDMEYRKIVRRDAFLARDLLNFLVDEGILRLKLEHPFLAFQVRNRVVMKLSRSRRNCSLFDWTSDSRDSNFDGRWG